MMVKWKLSLLSVMYFIQGIPYGFQSKFLPVYLRQLGQSLTNLGLYKLLLTPWLLKALWAPLIDRHANQRTWLLGSILGLGLCALFVAFINPINFLYLSVMLLMMNVLAASQDICVDRVAIELLERSELGVGNTVQVVGYKLGALFGGGVVLYLVEYTSWTIIFIIISSFYFTVFGGLMTVPRIGMMRTSEKEVVHLDYWNIVRTVIMSPGTVWMMGYLLLYKLGEQGALSLLPLYLYDLGADTGSLAVWSGVIGQIVSALGSASAGFLLSGERYDPFRLITVLFTVQFLPLLGLYLLTLVDYNLQMKFVLCMFCLYCLLLISGLVTTATFTAMMTCSLVAPPSVQATHYAALSTVEILGKLSFASLCGFLTDSFGYSNMYFFFILLSTSVPLYLTCKPTLDNKSS